MKMYVCVDLKSFYASVECVERGLDPFACNLVVADPSRGNGAITLAVTPKLKAMGIKGRSRIFELPKNIEYITAMPRMNLYMKYSANIYSIYLKYLSKEDVHVYSVDEVFLDVTNYLRLYKMNAKQLAMRMMEDIYTTTKITATAGIGTNMYLAKVAMDILAKHTPENIAYLNEKLYKEYLWHHKPIQDFWHVGRGIAKRLKKYQVEDMHGVAHMNEDILFKEFGVNARYLMDHAWGIEPTTMQDIKQYVSKNHSLSHSQILFEDYRYEDALLVVKEMVELKVLDLLERHLVTNQISLGIGYSKEEHASLHTSKKLNLRSNSLQYLKSAFVDLYRERVSTQHYIHRISIGFHDVVDEARESFDLFSDHESLKKEKDIQRAYLSIKHKYGKNAIYKGMNVLDKATTIKRNKLVGGHNAK